MSNRSDLAREIERNTEQRNEQRNRMREQQQAELTELGENYRNSYEKNMSLILESTTTATNKAKESLNKLTTTAETTNKQVTQQITELKAVLNHLPTTAETLINQALQPIDRIRSKIGQEVGALEQEQDSLDSLREKLANDRIKVEKAKVWLFYPLIALAAALIVLIGANWWLGASIQSKQQELAEIQQNIEQTPLQAQALAKVEITQNDDKSIWITAKNAKKSKAGTETNSNKPSLRLE